MTKALGDQVNVGFQLVNGWNNVEDNNSGKTMGFNANWTAKSKKVSLLYNSYVGPEKAGTNKGWRQIHEGLINYSPTDWWTGYFDYYHGHEAQASGVGTPAANWDAFGISEKFTMNAHNYVSFRHEYFGDHDGFATGYGSKLKLQEVTATYAYKWTQGLEMRAEWRRDWADQQFFEHGNEGQPLNPGIGTFTPGPWKYQNTFTIGFIAFFGGK
jgi:hypothetical protein